MRRAPLLLGLAGSSLAFNVNRFAAARDAVPSNSTACNGAAILCDRQYSSITLVGTHNSAFVGTGAADNQHVSVAQQLDLGVRFMTAQTHDKDGAVQLCHSECALRDAGPLSDYLKTVADWITAAGHEHEVVTVLLTNGDGLAIERYGDAIRDAGLDKLAYAPAGGMVAYDQWPTLREMIEANTRVVFMMDYHADTSKVPYVLPEFSHIWETPFGEEDPEFPTCDVDRPSDGDTNALMGLANHVLNKQLLPSFLGGLFGDEGVQVPAQDDAAKTNSAESLTKQADLCKNAHGKPPNIILVDWVEIGDAMAVQNKLNGLG